MRPCAFIKAGSGASRDHYGGGSTEDIVAPIMNRADIASSSAVITDEKLKLARRHNVYPAPLCTVNHCIWPVVDSSNPPKNIGGPDHKKIRLGTINNWQQMGVPDLAIDLISRDTVSDTCEVWHSTIMGHGPVTTIWLLKHSTSPAVQAISEKRGVIECIGPGYSNAGVKPLDGMIGRDQTLQDGGYSINRPLFMFSNG